MMLGAARLGLVAVVVAIGPEVWGCAAHGRAQGSVHVGTEADEDRRWEVDAPQSQGPRPVSSAIAPKEQETSPPRTEFYGILHDLSLKRGAVSGPSCTCLALAYGPPDDPRFDWKPGTRKREQGTFAIAISGDVECPPGRTTYLPKPSIAAVAYSGGEIVLTIEAAGQGKPMVRGVVGEQPSTGGAIVVRSRGDVPFGTPLGQASGSCRIPIQ
jgi:hypothetical protein